MIRGLGWQLRGPFKAPEETPPSPRNSDPIMGYGETRGTGTETEPPLPDVYEAVRTPWQQGVSNPLMYGSGWVETADPEGARPEPSMKSA